ncbi:MAG: hypothetical protein QM687_09410 [Ferruginibacter sp.]
MRRHIKNRVYRMALLAVLLLLLCPVHTLQAQPPANKYTFSNGKMQIRAQQKHQR